MAKIRWNGDDFRNAQDSSGTTADLISHGGTLQQGYRHGSLTQGLVAYYPMERGEGEILRDAALNKTGQIKTGSSGTTSVENMWNSNSKIGNNCIQFDGNDDEIVVDNDKGEISDVVSSTFTLSVWIKTSNESMQAVYRLDDGFGLSTILLNNKEGGGNTANYISFYDADSSNQVDYDTGSQLTDGEWHHIAVVRNSETSIRRIYFDGSLGASESTTSGSSSNTDLYIGRRPSGNNPLDGSMDDFRIYDRVLSSQEINALYSLGSTQGAKVTESDVPSNSDGGVSRWTMDNADLSSGTISDKWGSNDGTLKNSPTTGQPGYLGESFDFEGSNTEYIELPNTGVTSPVTVSAWIKPSKITNFERIFDQKNDFDLALVDDGEVSNRGGQILWEINGNNYWLGPEKELETNRWHHIVASIDSDGNGYYYRNGVLIEKKSQETVSGSNNNAYIANQGGGSSGDVYYGKIDEVRIYEKALTLQEVEKLYNLGAYRIPREATLQ